MKKFVKFSWDLTPVNRLPCFDHPQNGTGAYHEYTRQDLIFGAVIQAYSKSLFRTGF